MMKPQDLRARLQGVISFPVTPFAKDLSLDIDGLRKNLAHNARFPFCAVVAAGGTGELYSLDVEEHRQVVAATVEAFAGKAPVIAGVGGSLAVARAMAQSAAAAGADGILALPPLYTDAPDDGLVAYYRAIGESTPLGLLIYSRDWFKPSPALVGKLAEAIPTLIAWKDGQADLRRYQLIQQAVGDRLAWIGGAGDDMVPGYYAIGLRTYTSSIATISPALALALDKAAAAGDATTLLDLMGRYVTPLYAFRARKRGYEVSVMKAAMDLLGFVGGAVRPPLPNLTLPEREELGALLKGWSAYL